MHAEYVEVPQEVVDAINATKARGGRIIAVGTTSVRSLESAAQDALKKGTELVPFFGDTEIFIYPGYEYQLVDCLITNFHLPESTLIMLVSAFAGYENTMNAYKHAVENNTASSRTVIQCSSKRNDLVKIRFTSASSKLGNKAFIALSLARKSDRSLSRAEP